MQRYLTATDSTSYIEDHYDVIILGTGIAGLFTALNIDDNLRILVITKTSIKTNNSSLAQGGVATAIDIKTHYDDTLRAGAYFNNKGAVEILGTESQEAISKLMCYGVVFDRDEEGNLLYTQEGGHSQRNILHVRDETGKEIINALTDYLFKKKNIQILENSFAIDILTMDKEAKGVIILTNQGQKKAYLAKAVVLATGGIGQIYLNTTNEKITTGDGIAMAYRAGARLKDMEFVQFHPTSLFQKDKSQQSFLISEAVRGEGALLRNTLGEAFMKKYHEKRELAPRDIVARAIFKEMEITNHSCVYLDITHADQSYVKKRFPMIYSKCRSFGIDIAKEWIPVVPVEHYFMGGIETDLYGKTSINRLYACGECACTGVHGANRLASNSLLEGLVFSNRVAKAINQSICMSKDTIGHGFTGININHILNPSSKRSNNENTNNNIDLAKLRELLRETMNKYASIIRISAELKRAYWRISRLNELLGHYDYEQRSIEYFELVNMTMVALKVLESAYNRRVSLGAHYVIKDNDKRRA